MPCLTPYRGDTSQMLLFKIASCLEASGAAGAAVLSFNGRTGDVVLTLADVAAVADDIYVNESGDTMTGPLNMTAGQSYQYNSVNVIRAQTALNNYFFGPSGNLTTTGTGLTAVGANALLAVTTGINNTAVGLDALAANTTGENNVAIGSRALSTNTTGSNNNAVGRQALLDNTTGANNSATGRDALRANTTGTNNAAFGREALRLNTTGSGNLAIGLSALFFNSTGDNSVGIGYQSLLNATASFNTGIGFSALFDSTTGSLNTAIGYNTGRGITTGSNNTIIGAQVTGLAAGLSNNIILADGAGNQRINVDSSGNVGIGTPTPGATLDVVGDGVSPNIRAFGSGFPMVSTRSSNGSVITKIQSIGPDFGYVGTESSHPLHVIVGNSVKMAILTSGNVGIGTVAPGFGLTLGVAVALAMDSGANQRAGDAVLVGGTVTVANTTVTANTRVFLTRRVTGGTIGFAVTYTVIAATSFTITSDNVLDTSTYSYLLIEVP